jgi:hypothetical protein
MCGIEPTKLRPGMLDACCSIRNVRPATVSVPERAMELLLATVKYTVPLPEPLEPGLILTKEAFDIAVQAHPGFTVTATDPLLAAAGNDWPPAFNE